VIGRAVWWGVGGLVACVAFGLSVSWALVVTVAASIAGALN
jgi:hypothetical protein